MQIDPAGDVLDGVLDDTFLLVGSVFGQYFALYGQRNALLYSAVVYEPAVHWNSPRDKRGRHIGRSRKRAGR